MMKMKTIRLVTMLGLVLSLGATACGSGAKDCGGACSKIYDTCRIALQDQNGNALSKADCVTTCNGIEATTKQRAIDCIVGMTCSVDNLNACLQ